MSFKRSRDDKSDEYSSNKKRDERRDYDYYERSNKYSNTRLDDKYSNKKSNDKYLDDKFNDRDDKHNRFNDKNFNNRSNDKYSNDKYFNNKYSNDKFQFNKNNKYHDKTNDKSNKFNNNNQMNNQMNNQIKLETNIDPPVDDKPIVKEKINFNLSGKLLEDTNMYNGVVVKYNEPFEAAKPTKKWRLYPFKDDKPLDFIQINNKSFFLLGRERKVVDIPLDHPSISKQHAVIQFRKVEIERKDGSLNKEIRPYLMDLESSNQTFLNNKPIQPAKYYQLLEKDVIKFGFSSREYVVLINHEE